MNICLNYAASNAIAGDYHEWVNTPLYFAFNPYCDSDGITQANQEPLDPAVVSSVMTVFRTSYRSQAVIGNNRLQDPLYANQSAVYNGNGTNEPGLLQDGGPICFQASLRPPGGWTDIIENMAIGTYSADEMEIWQATAAQNQDGTYGHVNLSQSDLTTFPGLGW